MKPASKSRTAKQPDRQRSSRSPSAELAGQIQMLRMRVTGAEATLKQARAQVDQAKRRRKIAKLLVKRARKGAKQAKIELQESRDALARAEAALITKSQPRAAKRQTRKPKTVGRSATAPARKRSAAPLIRRTPSRGKVRTSAPTAPPAPAGPFEESVVPLAAELVSPLASPTESLPGVALETSAEIPNNRD